MKSPSLILIPVLAGALLLPTSLTAQSGPDGFQAGAAAVDITPTVFPMRLRSGKSDVVNDPIHVRATAFQNGEGRAAIVLIDQLGSSREWTDEAKLMAANATGWKTSEMLISATHAHTTPRAGGTSESELAFRKQLIDGMAQAIIQSVERLQPAEVGFGSEDLAEEVYNRRWFLREGTMPPNPFGGLDQVKMNPNRRDIVRPAGPTDPEICVVDVRTESGKPLALLANYSLHYIGSVPEKSASAGYFGEFARIMPYRMGGRTPPAGFVAMMTNGTSGDINNIDFYQTRAPRAPFEQCRVVATKAADAAWRATRDLDHAEAPIVAMRERKVVLKVRSVTEQDVARAMEMLALPKSEEENLPGKALQYARSTLRHEEPDQTLEVIIQAVRIGDQAIVTFPFETLVEIGLEIKERSPFEHTFTISLANGSHGYLPTPEQHELGGYETWIGTSKVEKESSVILTNHLLEMLEELRAL